METTVSNGKFCPEDIDYLCAELERQRWVRTATTEDGATYMSPGGNWVAALGSAGVTWVHKGAPSDRLSGRCSVQTVMNQIDRIDDPVPTFGEWGGVFRQAGWQPFASKGASGYKSPGSPRIRLTGTGAGTATRDGLLSASKTSVNVS